MPLVLGAGIGGKAGNVAQRSPEEALAAIKTNEKSMRMPAASLRMTISLIQRAPRPGSGITYLNGKD